MLACFFHGFFKSFVFKSSKSSQIFSLVNLKNLIAKIKKRNRKIIIEKLYKGITKIKFSPWLNDIINESPSSSWEWISELVNIFGFVFSDFFI